MAHKTASSKKKPPLNPEAMAFFVKAGKLGGQTRAENLSPARRLEIAIMGAKAAAKKRQETSAA